MINAIYPSKVNIGSRYIHYDHEQIRTEMTAVLQLKTRILSKCHFSHPKQLSVSPVPQSSHESSPPNGDGLSWGRVWPHTDVLNVTSVCLSVCLSVCMHTLYRKYILLQITEPERLHASCESQSFNSEHGGVVFSKHFSNISANNGGETKM